MHISCICLWVCIMISYDIKLDFKLGKANTIFMYFPLRFPCCHQKLGILNGWAVMNRLCWYDSLWLKAKNKFRIDDDDDDVWFSHGFARHLEVGKY